MEEFSFSQAVLAKLTRVSTAGISRAIAAKGLIPMPSESKHKKRFDIKSCREITKGVFANARSPIAQKIQVFYNFKGGTGKTSLCFQVGVHLSILGYRVLCVDLDPQGHLTSVLGVTDGENFPTIYDVLINGTFLEETKLEVFPGLDLIPSNISLTRIEVPLSQQNRREEKLKKILYSQGDNYDFIIVDTNPTISTLNMNALVASDRINIICETQPFSLSGLQVLLEELNKFYGDMGVDPNYCIIPNKYESKTATAQEVLGTLRTQYGNLIFDAIVRKSEDINIASKKHLPVSAFCKSSSHAFEDISDLVHDLIDASIIREDAEEAA